MNDGARGAGNTPDAYLGDSGLTIKRRDEMLRGKCGTLRYVRYIAPELLEDREHDEKVDR